MRRTKETEESGGGADASGSIHASGVRSAVTGTRGLLEYDCVVRVSLLRPQGAEKCHSRTRTNGQRHHAHLGAACHAGACCTVVTYS
eukprot:3382827-Prymnesium_polylepis.1